MVARLKIDTEVLLETYERTGSLRATGRELNMGHMVIRGHLVRLGINPEEKRLPAEEAMSPTSRIYLKPSAIAAIDELAQGIGIGRHEFGRLLVDAALKMHKEGNLPLG